MDVKAVLVVADTGSPRGAVRKRTAIRALEHVGNQAIAHHVCEGLASAGVAEIIVVSSPAGVQDIREAINPARRGSGPTIRYMADEAGVGDIYDGLRSAAPLVGESPCIVHCADGLLEHALDDLLDWARAPEPGLLLVLHRSAAPRDRLSTATIEALAVPEAVGTGSGLGLAGVCLVGPGALLGAQASLSATAERSGLVALAQAMTAAGGGFETRVVDFWRRYDGDPLDLLELNRVVLDRLSADIRPAAHDDSRVEGRVQVHESACVQSSVIVGPVVIGPRARIADAYIGPYTSVGAEARIEGAEIERSIISPGATVRHVGDRLLASVVGRNARVFRDFSLPRALRLRVGDGTEVALC
jgi:glucose-1-phosphate thymidylyltransferase